MAIDFYDHKIPEVLKSLENDTLRMVVVALADMYDVDPKFLVELCQRMKNVKDEKY